MTHPVHITLDQGVALITIDNPPVNVTSQAVRAGLMAALDQAEGAERVVLTGAGSAFVAGADAREFAAPPQPPHLPDIVARIEGFPCPVVAALNGAALGGGLELALGCAMRVAGPKAKLGLPEVTLGVVPGAGGTQRLPRLTGFAEAAALISEGRVIDAQAALAIGLVDALADDPVAAARTLPVPDRPATGALPNPPLDAGLVATLRSQAASRMKGQVAPQKALDLVEAATRLPLAEGLALERATFLDLKTSDQAAALRHVFFAERAALSRARKIGAPPRALASAVVVGGGTMGAGIAYALDGIGLAVTLVETDDAAADRARANLARLFDEAVRRGKSSEAAAETGKARIAVVAGYGNLPPADIAIEAVFENLDVKRAVFAALDAALPETAILATNTSYLDVNRIFDGLRNPGRCLGLHFFSPAHVMKLIEIIQAETTSDETLATAFALAAKLGKMPVQAGVCDGFIGNRILTRYRQICDVMLIEGALPWQVDRAMTGFGMAMGPYAVQDLSGLDIAYANRQRKNLRSATDIRYIPIADRMVEDLKRLGRKSGGGWYDYPAEGPATPADAVKALVLAASAEAGITRRDFTDQEITDRAVTAMIDEGLRILDEGIARSPADIDLVLVHGYGFPRWRGGVMHHADGIGTQVLLNRIAAWAGADPLSWSVPPLLQRLADEGRTIASLSQDERADP